MSKHVTRNITNRTSVHVLTGVFASVVFSMTLGCNPPTSTINGKVTFKDEPITTGTIAFVSQNGKVISGNIEFGKYEVSGVEIGPGATVVIMSHEPSPMMQPPTGPLFEEPEKDPLKYVPIPAKYGNHELSGLKVDVVQGKQTHDFTLQD